ncbi:MAG TPA: class I SAM-dependent methyltransferase [Polyangiaceae bacterium]|nr:class I SAM-dependent methyltransferase [Polyangiaceae bacterium]
MSQPPYSQIKACRASGSENLVSVLHLGMQSLTGVFPRSPEAPVTKGPLELVWCPDSGLLQLNHTYDPAEMYGDNYGYRSGLNQSMVRHLQGKVRRLQAMVPLSPGDTVVDIGSNDATLLKSYASSKIERVGIDPTGAKFEPYYSDDIKLVADFFSRRSFERASTKKARIVTSIAMFYDLDDPVAFAREVEEILADDGIWHFEQSYMPSMLRTNSYDTICHEHLEYYSISIVKSIVERAGLKILDVQMNGVNGGSFAVTAAKRGSRRAADDAMIDWLLEQEKRMGLETPRPFRDFEERVFRHREDLRRLVRALAGDGKKILGYGASTKGNVVLQFCGLTRDEIPAIAEVNPDKFGCITPGTHIPIVSEEEARAMKPDFFLVLPWHFKSGIVEREKEFLERGGKVIFPFPEIEIV